MADFTICTLTDQDYDNFLLCLTFESIANYYDLIEQHPFIVHKTGRLLVDQLLVSGNNGNRFLRCSYRNGKLDFSTIRDVIPDMKYRQLAVKLLHENCASLANSILTEAQRKLVEEEVAF